MSKKQAINYAEQDELFWREQENRLTRQIGQPCCSLSGMTSLLVGMAGNFAVVLHSESDCANCFLHTQGPSAPQFYSTRVSQARFTTGKLAEPLRRVLELVIKHRRPEAVFVLGNCLVEMIHDDFEGVAKKVQEKIGTPVLAMRTSGLRAGSQAEMIDWLYSTLAGLGSKKKARGGTGLRRVNLIGTPELNHENARSELERVLSAAGIRINGSYPFEADLGDWQNIGEASANFVVDKTLFPKLLKKLGAAGLPSIEVPLPVGLEQTTRFLNAIGAHFGAEKEIERAIASDVSRLEARLGSFRKRFGGMRVAVGLRMVNNYRADQLAYDGLGDLNVFVEAGFDPTLFIQGPPEEKARRHFAQRLKSLGCELPFHVFPDPFDLPPLLRAGKFDVAYLADHARTEARKAGVPLIQSRSLEPLFGGALRNIDYLEKVLVEIQRERGRRSCDAKPAGS